MEHDDQRIREKILQAEQGDAAWSKDYVWSAIRRTGKPAWHFTIYYAAATLLLASAIIFYSLESTQRQQLLQQISENELRMEQLVNARSASSGLANHAMLATECPKESNVAPQIPRYAKRAAVKHAPLASSNQMAVSTPVVYEPAVSIEIQEMLPLGEAVPTTPGMAPEKRVRPIIGTSLLVTNTQANLKDQRLQIQLFRSDEQQTLTKTSASSTNFAGINNQ